MIGYEVCYRCRIDHFSALVKSVLPSLKAESDRVGASIKWWQKNVKPAGEDWSADDDDILPADSIAPGIPVKTMDDLAAAIDGLRHQYQKQADAGWRALGRCRGCGKTLYAGQRDYCVACGRDGIPGKRRVYKQRKEKAVRARVKATKTTRQGTA